MAQLLATQPAIERRIEKRGATFLIAVAALGISWRFAIRIIGWFIHRRAQVWSSHRRLRGDPRGRLILAVALLLVLLVEKSTVAAAIGCGGHGCSCGVVWTRLLLRAVRLLDRCRSKVWRQSRLSRPIPRSSGVRRAVLEAFLASACRRKAGWICRPRNGRAKTPDPPAKGHDDTGRSGLRFRHDVGAGSARYPRTEKGASEWRSTTRTGASANYPSIAGGSQFRRQDQQPRRSCCAQPTAPSPPRGRSASRRADGRSRAASLNFRLSTDGKREN